MKFLYFAVLLVIRQTECIKLREQTVDTRKTEKCPFLDGVYISVMRRIFNQGFHKELLTEVELMLTTSILPDKCLLLMEETIPRGMYVDPDQMRNILGLRSYVPEKVDVEKPEFESESFRIYIFRDLRIQENLRVTSAEFPIHVRYHKPDVPSNPNPHFELTAVSPSATVKIQNPRLLLRCDATSDGAELTCPERTVTSYCDSSGTNKCEYVVLPYKVNTKFVEISVPVGNAEHTPYVVGITTFIVSGGTVYLMVSLFRKDEQNRF